MANCLGQRLVERLLKMEAEKAEGKEKVCPSEFMDSFLRQHVPRESRWVIEETLNEMDEKEQEEENG